MCALGRSRLVTYFLNQIARQVAHYMEVDLVSELTDQLEAINNQLTQISQTQTKAYDEITQQITDLKANPVVVDDPAALAAANAIQAQVDVLAGQTQALDDVVPDQPPA